MDKDKIERQLKYDIIKIGSLLYKKGLIVAFDGNISVRYNDKIWITPTRMCKGRLTIQDLVQVDLEGNILQSPNNHKPTSELIMHLKIYQHRKEVNAILHIPLLYYRNFNWHILDEYIPEAYLILGDVPTADYALTGTKEMFEAIKPFLNYNAILLSHHGALTLGKSLQDAYYLMEQLIVQRFYV
jgi:L-fuculose-phosphate aldolase